MKLWLLKPHSSDHPWWKGYDVAEGFVVRAFTEAGARVFAQEQGGDETGLFNKRERAAWLSDEHSTCIELTTDGDAGVVLRDFRAG